MNKVCGPGSLAETPLRICPFCEGAGEVEFGSMLSPWMRQCLECMGDGYVVDDDAAWLLGAPEKDGS